MTALGEVLGYCEPGSGAAPRWGPLFRRVARALPRGGLLWFDLIVAGQPLLAARTWTAGDGWVVLAESREDPRRARLTRDIVTFRRIRGGAWRRNRERHRVRVASRSEVEDALRAAGFSVRVSRRLGGFALAPRRLAFRARKRREGLLMEVWAPGGRRAPGAARRMTRDGSRVVRRRGGSGASPTAS